MRDLQPRARGPLGMSPLKRLKRSSLPPRQKADRRTAESPSSSCLTSSSSSCHLDPSSPSSSAGICNAPEFDEELHSRQLAVYGWEAMRRISASNVLISGLNGLGAEIAKNIVLAGVKSVTLHDEGTVGFSDLSSNFLLWDEDVGRNRALACAEKLQELNNLVEISTMTDELRKANLSSFQAAVFTDISLAKAIEYNDYCHNWQHPIFFIKAEVRGLFGSVFCDFGPKFSVVDVDGEEPHTGTVVSISKDEPALVECVDDERLEFQDGDSVIFSDVEGMTELNDGKPRKVKNAGPHSFSIEEDTYWFCDYKTGGKVTQVKEPKVLRFKPLKDALRDPGDFLCTYFSKAERSALLHLAFQALDAFRNACRCFPVAGCEKDAKTLIDMAVQFNESMGCNKLKEIDETLVCHFASGSGSVLNPMAAMFGGIAGGEVLKACSGKFHPLFQFFYFDSVESLPTEPLDANDLKPLGCRYDAQISVFGSKLQKKLEAAQVFLLGSGGLGCELLKNLALMGVCCSPNGKLTVTDYDVVKKSNLGHQFMFREWDVGAFKSFVAACAASSINPNLHIKSLKHRVDEETLDVFDNEFWESLDVVVNALDNVQPRIFMDFGKLKAAKVVAGWVVPAIATSTALAAGLVCLELYKVLAGGDNVEDYCNTFWFSMKKLVRQFGTVGLC